MLYANAIVPEKMYQYLVEQNMTGLATFQSGAVIPAAEINSLLSGGGINFKVPFFPDLSGDSSVLSDTSDLSTDALTPSQQIGSIHFRGKGFKASDLAASASGSDPVGAIQSGLLRYWDKQFNTMMVAAAKGILASSGCPILNDQSGSSIADTLVVDTLAKVGESQSDFVAVAMHPAIYAALRKDDLIDTVVPSTSAPFQTYMGMRVILDNTLSADTSVYTTIFLRRGAFYYGENAAGITPIELDRDAAKGIDLIYTRRRFALHPANWSFVGTPAGISPTNVELAVGTNWSNVASVNDMHRFVALKSLV